MTWCSGGRLLLRKASAKAGASTPVTGRGALARQDSTRSASSCELGKREGVCNTTVAIESCSRMQDVEVLASTVYGQVLLWPDQYAEFELTVRMAPI